MIIIALFVVQDCCLVLINQAAGDHPVSLFQDRNEPIKVVERIKYLFPPYEISFLKYLTESWWLISVLFVMRDILSRRIDLAMLGSSSSLCFKRANGSRFMDDTITSYNDIGVQTSGHCLSCRKLSFMGCVHLILSDLFILKLLK